MGPMRNEPDTAAFIFCTPPWPAHVPGRGRLWTIDVANLNVVRLCVQGHVLSFKDGQAW